MCVSMPGRVISVGHPTPVSIPARVLIADRELDVDLVMVPEAGAGDFVFVHSGYAIEIIPRQRALETLDLLGVDRREGS